MERKLVEQGKKTLMVSIPAKWAKSHKLTKGSTVSLEATSDRIILLPKVEHSKKELKIKLNTQSESAIRTLITNAYRSGFDKVIVEFDDSKQFEMLDEIIKTRLIGFDILKKEKNRCIIENVTEPTGEYFENILSKIFLNIISLFKSVQEEGNEKDIGAIEERIQKYDNLCRRMISKKNVNEEHKERYWSFLTLLIHAQREIFFLSKNNDKEKMSKNEKEMISEAEEMFELIEKAYKEKRIDLLEKLHDKEKNLIYKKGYEMLKKSKGKESIRIYHILSAIRQCYQANSPLCGIILGRQNLQ